MEKAVNRLQKKQPRNRRIERLNDSGRVRKDDRGDAQTVQAGLERRAIPEEWTETILLVAITIGTMTLEPVSF